MHQRKCLDPTSSSHPKRNNLQDSHYWLGTWVKNQCQILQYWGSGNAFQVLYAYAICQTAILSAPPLPSACVFLDFKFPLPANINKCINIWTIPTVKFYSSIFWLLLTKIRLKCSIKVLAQMQNILYLKQNLLRSVCDDKVASSSLKLFSRIQLFSKWILQDSSI